MAAFQKAGVLPLIFLFFATISAICGVLCLGLPRVDEAKMEDRTARDAT
jgi:hypothetical protein